MGSGDRGRSGAEIGVREIGVREIGVSAFGDRGQCLPRVREIGVSAFGDRGQSEIGVSAFD